MTDRRFNQSLLRILVCSITLALMGLGCPDPNRRVLFEYGRKLKTPLKVKFADGRGELKIYGDGFYSQTTDQQFHIAFDCFISYPEKAGVHLAHPRNARLTLGGELLPLEDRYLLPDSAGKPDPEHLSFMFTCSPCFDVCLDSLSDSDCPRLALDLSAVIEQGGEYVPIDTIFARVPKRIVYWARRLKTQGY